MNGGLSQSDIDAIARAREVFMTGIVNDDVDAMTAMITDDTQAFPPDEPAVVGKAASGDWHEQRITEFETDFTASTEELVGEGSMAFELFSYTLTLTPKAGGEPIKDSGRCLWIWRREGGDWKVARAMWNSPQPLPGA